MNAYIIPTLGRSTLQRAIDSILMNDSQALILLGAGGDAIENRNKCLDSLDTNKTDFVFFLDDDDFFSQGILDELNNDIDLLILRGDINGQTLPETTAYENIAPCHVGINFGFRFSKYSDVRFKYGEEANKQFIEMEDWRFIETILKMTPKEKVKTTEKIYYNAPIKGNFQKI